jgi:hypothetical protein
MEEQYTLRCVLIETWKMCAWILKVLDQRRRNIMLNWAEFIDIHALAQILGSMYELGKLRVTLIVGLFVSKT